MNKRINKRISVSFILIFLLVSSIYTGLNAHAYPEETVERKEMGCKYMGILTVPGDNNLYDGRFLLYNKDEIALTKEQEEKIENLILDHEAFKIRHSGEIKIKELRFASYLKSGQMDRGEVEKYIREISKEKTNMIVQYMNYLLDLKTILTPGQLLEMAEIRAKCMARQKTKKTVE